jgi:hypothetical protein
MQQVSPSEASWHRSQVIGCRELYGSRGQRQKRGCAVDRREVMQEQNRDTRKERCWYAKVCAISGFVSRYIDMQSRFNVLTTRVCS